MPAMTVEQASTRTPPAPEARLKGVWLAVLRAAWVLLLLLQVGIFVASVPVFYAAQVQFAATPEMSTRLLRLALSPDAYAIGKTILRVIVAGVCIAVAMVIGWRRSDAPIALVVALLLLGWGGGPDPSHVVALPSWLQGPATLIGFVGFASLSPFFYLFPDGRFVPRWTRWVTPLWIAIQAGITIVPFTPLNIWGWPLPLMIVALCTFLGSLIFAPIYRYRYVAGPIQRQQIKWTVCAGVVGVMIGLAALFLRVVFPAQVQPGTLLYLLGEVAFAAAQMAVVLSIGRAVLRYRLWDIDPLINRTLVYGGLTLGMVALYSFVVAGLGSLLQAQGNFVLSLLATGLIAVLFQPVRVGLQRRVNRLMYGERDDPYAVLSRLGRRLEATLAPDAVLPTIVETVREMLKLPYVAIVLRQDGEFVVAAAAGAEVDEVLHVPLVYQNESVGELRLAPRARGEPFASADRSLLEALARQAGVAVHGVRLTADLQRARATRRRTGRGAPPSTAGSPRRPRAAAGQPAADDRRRAEGVGTQSAWCGRPASAAQSTVAGCRRRYSPPDL